MSLGRLVVVVGVCFGGLVTKVSAQDVRSAPQAPLPIEVSLNADQGRDLATWLSAMRKWQEYDRKWQNRPVHDGWGRVVARQPPPDAPAWLAPRCAELRTARLLELDSRLAHACALVDDPRATPAIAVVVPDVEKPPKHTTFWSRVHLDGLATTTPTGARTYGIIGSHVSLVDVGRLQLFGPPGVMLLTVPDGQGGRRVTFGYTWGVSVRLIDLGLSSSTKNMTLFINVSKVWLGSGEVAGQKMRGYDIIGLSLAPRKQPPRQ
jgi:hypothetical protein